MYGASDQGSLGITRLVKLALYARVSKPQRGQLTDAQAKEQNPEVQLRELREWCRANKHAITEEYVERLSGKNTKRPQLQKLMRDAVKGLRDIEGVLVWRLDRFGRSVRDLHNLIAELDEAGIAFICLKDGFDLTTSGGRAMFGMLAVFAEFERDRGAYQGWVSPGKSGRPHSRPQDRSPQRTEPDYPLATLQTASGLITSVSYRPKSNINDLEAISGPPAPKQPFKPSLNLAETNQVIEKPSLI